MDIKLGCIVEVEIPRYFYRGTENNWERIELAPDVIFGKVVGIRDTQLESKSFREYCVHIENSDYMDLNQNVWHHSDCVKISPDNNQHHLNLDDFKIESTGKSVSADDVIAQIDKALETN